MIYYWVWNPIKKPQTILADYFLDKNIKYVSNLSSVKLTLLIYYASKITHNNIKHLFSNYKVNIIINKVNAFDHEGRRKINMATSSTPVKGP